MTDHINWSDICGKNDDALLTLLDGLDNILDSSLEIFLSVQVTGELEDLVTELVVREGVCDGGHEECL